MSWSKRQIITQALEEIGIASHTFDVRPDEFQSALRRLDAMVATWNAIGIQLGYPLVDDFYAADLDDATAMPDWAIEAGILGLASRLAPSYGKQVSPDTRIALTHAMRAMQNRTSQPTIEMGWPHGMPSGAGNKPQWRYNDVFLDTTPSPLEESPGNEINLNLYEI